MLENYKKISLAAAACTLLITNASQAAVTVTFSQVGTNVVAAWSGSITPGSWVLDSVGNGGSLSGGEANGLYIITDLVSYDRWSGGVWSGSSLTTAPTSYTGGTFGFYFNFFFYNAQDNNLEDAATVTFNPSFHTMTWANKTLDGIGASSFNNTLAWTANSGGANTISFNTVPEPSSALLGVFGVLALVCRRRRGLPQS